MNVTRRLLTAIVAIISIFIILSCNPREDSYESPSTSTLFTALDTVSIKDFRGDPLYDSYNTRATNEEIIIPETKQNKILIYGRYGSPIKEIGRTGKGPLEFNLPYDAVRSRSGDLYVLDRKNERIQILTENGEQKDIINGITQAHEIELRGGEEPTLLVLAPTGCGEEPCLVTEYGEFGSVKDRYAILNNDQMHLYSWVMAQDGNKVHVSNILNYIIRVYENGKHVEDIKLDSPSLIDIELEQDPGSREALQAQLDKLRSEVHTRIRSIDVYGGHIFVCNEIRNAEHDRFFVDIYTTSGELVYHGVEVPGIMLNIDNGEIYFRSQIFLEDYMNLKIYSFGINSTPFK